MDWYTQIWNMYHISFIDMELFFIYRMYST